MADGALIDYNSPVITLNAGITFHGLAVNQSPSHLQCFKPFDLLFWAFGFILFDYSLTAVLNW